MTDDEHGLGLEEELWLVRRELDRLSSERLLHFLSPEEEDAYRALAARELKLIGMLFDRAATIDLAEPVDVTDDPAEAVNEGGDTSP